jgi:hypothetical protein
MADIILPDGRLVPQPLHPLTLALLFERLTDTTRPARPEPFARRVAGLAADRDPRAVVHRHELLADLEGCLGEPFDPQTVETLAGALRYPSGFFCSRPRRGEQAMFMSYCWGLTEYTALLFGLARFGFPVDPMPLHALVAPAIPRKGMIGRAELHVLWGPREMRCSDVSLHAAGGDDPPAYRKGRTASGHRLGLELAGAGSRLDARGPGFRSSMVDPRLRVAAGMAAPVEPATGGEP